MAEEAIEITYGLKIELRRRPSEATREADPGPCEHPLQRVTRLMALAIKLDRPLREGIIRNHGQLARLGHVSRSRVTQVMNLLYLAPDIQERLLFLPVIEEGGDTITEAAIRKLAQRHDWDQQRQLFRELLCSRSGRVRKAGRHSPAQENQRT